MVEPKMHIIIPYFNHTNARVNRRNLELCLRNLSINHDCLVVLVEGIWNREAELPDFSSSIYRHLKFDLSSPIWVKENLINLAIRSLGNDWEYACWMDKDIQFLNPGWVKETIHKLKECDILQPWSHGIFLGLHHEVEPLGEIRDFQKNEFSCLQDPRGVMSFCKAIKLPGKRGHMGNAWAIRKSFYHRLGKIFDRCILGGGDSFISSSIEESKGLKPQIAGDMTVYREFLEIYREAFRGVCVGFVEGTIIHHFHGDMNSRQYWDRHLILEDASFRPLSDLIYAENGTLKLLNKKLEKAVHDYFYSRKEHLL